jgi:hypothetical protein
VHFGLAFLRSILVSARTIPGAATAGVEQPPEISFEFSDLRSGRAGGRWFGVWNFYKMSISSPPLRGGLEIIRGLLAQLKRVEQGELGGPVYTAFPDPKT